VTPRESAGQTPARYLAPLRHRWPVIAVVVVICVGVAALIAYSSPKKYRASAEILVTPVESSGTSDVFVNLDVLHDPTTSIYVVGRVPTTPQATAIVRRRLNLSESRTELLKSVSVKPVQQSSLIVITGKSSSAEGAAALANAFADATVAVRTDAFQRSVDRAIADTTAAMESSGNRSASEVQALQQRLGELRAQAGSADPSLRIFSRALRPPSAASPRPLLILVIAALAALLLGVAFALVIEAVDQRIIDDDQVGDELPVLASIPRMRRDVASSQLQGDGRLPGDVWDAYRRLRAAIGASLDEGVRTVLVTSAITGEAKTTTALNLSVALAASGRRVVLVDGNVRDPAIPRGFGIDVEQDRLTPLLAGRTNVDELLLPVPGYGDRLRVVVAAGDASIDLLETRRIERMLGALKDYADVVLIDGGAATESADALAWATAVDGVIIAVRVGASRHDRLEELRQLLDRAGVRQLGTVLTSRHRARRRLERRPFFAEPVNASARAIPSGLDEGVARAAERQS
jgi:Mrp family chromosome partitioning ATPase